MCLYADDLIYSTSADGSFELKDTIEAKYRNVVQYVAMNKLVLNTKKTHLLIMASKRQHRLHSNYGITFNTEAEETTRSYCLK